MSAAARGEPADVTTPEGEATDDTTVDALCAEVARLVATEPERALELAEEARRRAAAGSAASRGKSARAAANALHFSGRYGEAQALYDEALARLEGGGETLQAAVTRSSALYNLAAQGDVDTAAAWYAAARRVFAAVDDRARLAVLEHNWANVLHRQDRLGDALERYRAAYEEFRRAGRALDAAICLRNIAVCQISRHDFAEALAAYEECRAYAAAESLDQLLLEVDYNVAYLYYLRGEYARAVELFRAARRRCEAAGDAYHVALCDLDQSEIYLELNLVADAALLARRAGEAFTRLGLAYERGKALTNAAIATSRRGHGAEALSELAAAREIFVAERNSLWPALIDFYRGVVLSRMGRPAEAGPVAAAALATFDARGFGPRAAMCELLLADLAVDLGDLVAARGHCQRAMVRLEPLALPALQYQAHRVLGRVAEAGGDPRTALDAYEESHRWLERLRDQLAGEDLKIAFLEDKQGLYESLVTLILAAGGADAAERALTYVEAAKSRTLQDLLAFRSESLAPKEPVRRELATRARALRQELHWLYRHIDQRHMATAGAAPPVVATSAALPAADGADVAALQRRTRSREEELLRTLRELQATDRELRSLQGTAPDLAAVRAALPEDAALVEYFIARGRILAAVIDRDGVRMLPLGDEAEVRGRYRLLEFQLTRARRAVATAPQLVERAVARHLRELWDDLVAPLAAYLDRRSWVIVPHGFLHHVPFHALHDGARYLVDHLAVSYAPSAAVFQLCASKEAAWEEESLVLGVADEQAPRIADEARAVAEILPRSTLLVGTDATAEALARDGGRARFVHLATHGLFRRDNPMFSALRLGTSRLSLADLYGLRLAAELVVLSGCGTGRSAVLGADELVGLTRGLLYAGAHSVLVSLWEVDDASTTELMRRFYLHLAAGERRASALSRAMADLRQTAPSPYHWAPFVLVGRP